MRIIWMVAAIVFAPPVGAQAQGELRKCMDASGGISFQQTPCAKGSRQVGSRVYTPDPLPTAEQIQVRHARQQAARAESAELSRRAGTVPTPGGHMGGGTLHRVSIARDDAACQRARRHREQTLAAVGMKRTYDLLRVLNDQVAEACR